MAVRDDFAAGEVLAAADLNDTFASKVDYALPVNAQTGTTYTFVAADAEKLTTASNASPVTLTIPPASSVAWPDNTVLRVVNYGAGAVTVDGGSGVTVTNTASTIAQYGAAVAIRTGSDAWTVVPFGGGDIPAATVSSPAATGQYTDSGITYDYYTFTASGTLTVDTAGFADVLVVGGGGGGGYNHGGGGGAGAATVLNSQYLPAGSHTITVGAGGSSASTYFIGQAGSTSRIGNQIEGVGGGGGGSRLDKATQTLPGSGGSGGGAGGEDVATTPGVALSIFGNSGGANAGTGAGATGGGGGGAGGAGANGVSGGVGGAGGSGITSTITGSSLSYAGGGGGRGATTGGAGGSGVGGAGANNTGTGGTGTANRGGGGGGGGSLGAGGSGGSGVVIIRVKV